MRIIPSVCFILLWKEATYVEIQDLPKKPDSGTAIKTIYVTASFPTSLSASDQSDISV